MARKNVYPFIPVSLAVEKLLQKSESQRRQDFDDACRGLRWNLYYFRLRMTSRVWGWLTFWRRDSK